MQDAEGESDAPLGGGRTESAEKRAERIRHSIARIASGRSNVTFREIWWVTDQLERLGTVVEMRKARHGYLFAVGRRRFMVNTHNPGGKQVTKYSVDDFLDAMTELGWYEE